jgi:hypothetical protein
VQAGADAIVLSSPKTHREVQARRSPSRAPKQECVCGRPDALAKLAATLVPWPRTISS